MSRNPLQTISRKVSDGFEYVTITFEGQWMKQLEYQSELKEGDNPDDHKMWYKQYLAEMCGYPETEWERIVGVVAAPAMVSSGVTLTVQFANPGKQFEEAMRVAGWGIEIVEDKDEFLLVKHSYEHNKDDREVVGKITKGALAWVTSQPTSAS